MKGHIFGIDRVKLKNIPIDKINIEKLKEKGFIVIQEDNKSFRILKDSVTGEEIGINYIKVSRQQDNTLRINELKVGRNRIPGPFPFADYEHLDINLPMQISRQGINDKNINNSKDLIEALGLVSWELEGLGFGEVDLINSELKEIEINCNIPIEKDFKEYERVIEYLYRLLPGTLKNYNKHEKQRRYTGMVVGNTQQEIKIYDKQRQVKEKTGIEIEKRLRLEYTFKTESKIKAVFGDNKLMAVIEDDFNKLQEVMKGIVFNDLMSRAYKDLDKQVKHAIKHIQEQRGIGGGSNSVDEYLKNHQSNLMDSEIVLEALRTVASKRHYASEGRRAIKSMERIEGINLFGNINKLNEILGRIGYEKIKMDITPTVKKEVEKHY